MKLEVYKDAFKSTSKKLKLTSKSVIYLEINTAEALTLIGELTKAVDHALHKNQPKVAINHAASNHDASASRFSIVVNKVL